jgi:hypothetical protein
MRMLPPGPSILASDHCGPLGVLLKNFAAGGTYLTNEYCLEVFGPIFEISGTILIPPPVGDIREVQHMVAFFCVFGGLDLPVWT